MKKSFIMAVAAIAALSSCSNDDILSTENGNNTAKAPVFTATIESEGNTRTVLSNNKVEWTNTDKVFIGAFTAEYVPVVLGEYSVVPGSNATSATLNPGSDLKYTAEGAPITTVGVYPASISFINGMDKETIASYAANQPMALMEGIGAIVLPATQTYNGNDISKIAPMVGVGSTELQFSNLTALLAISVPSTQITSVQKITISGDIRLNGNFGISFVEGEAKLFPTASPTDAEKKITLDCQSEGANTTIPSGGSKTFYVSIPANTYSYLQIDVTDGTSTKTMKTKASSITVARNNIYNIAFEDNQTSNTSATTGTAKATIGGNEVEVAWVQLWKDGPKFATQNVSSQITFTEATKTGSDFVWGANWKCPSKSEIDLLNTSKVSRTCCQENGTWGFKITGVQTGYTSNTLFLPAQSYVSAYNEVYAYYWTSTKDDDDNTCQLTFGFEDGNDESAFEYFGVMPNAYVRPILNE